MENIIEVQNLRYKYKKESSKYIINNITFYVRRGEWLSIIGHNGSGKSTTIRLLDGLLDPENGDIYISGKKLTPNNVWDVRQDIGIVFQNPDNQFVGATVEDDVAFGLENRGLSLLDMRERVETALKMVDMWEFKDREPACLSGGQKQRVAVAGIVALRPRIIILDEATSMIDPEGRIELMKLVKNIKDNYGLTIISITHDLDEVELSDRVLVMKSGQVESISTPRELFARKDLRDLDLDQPFTEQVKKMLKEQGFDVPLAYLTEKELQDYIWESVLNK